MTEQSGVDYDGMSLEELERTLTRRERRFVEEYERDGNGTQAAIRAGYAAGKDNASAAVQASKLLRLAKVSAYRRARALGINADTIRLNVMEVYRRCMTEKPVLRYDAGQKDWVETGEYDFDSKGALKAMELMGKITGTFAPAPPGGAPGDGQEDDPITRALKEEIHGPVG